MKSNVCKIENGINDLEKILIESEKVAVYNGLDHKQTLQLRLICEEIDGMLPNIIDDFNGDFWIEFEEGVCKVKASVTLSELTANKKQELIAVAKNKRNAAATGIVGKIRSALEDFFLDEETLEAYSMSLSGVHLATGYSEGIDYAYLWSLEQYRKSVQTKEPTDKEWDELEKSVIASVADDVIVGVKGKRADVVVIKKFA